jgi:hypothetical protein
MERVLCAYRTGGEASMGVEAGASLRNHVSNVVGGPVYRQLAGSTDSLNIALGCEPLNNWVLIQEQILLEGAYRFVTTQLGFTGEL